MSSDIVPYQHVQVLVHTAIEGCEGSRGRDPLSWYTLPCSQLAGVPWHELDDFQRRASPENADLIGQMLFDEAVVSYGHLNPEVPFEHYPMWVRLPYVHHRLPFRLTAPEVLKAISTFEYQSGEHDGWCESEAASFCQALAYSVYPYLEGYKRAPSWWNADVMECRLGTHFALEASVTPSALSRLLRKG